MKDMKGMKGRGPGFWERIDHGWHGWERILLRQGYTTPPACHKPSLSLLPSLSPPFLTDHKY
jgi:hypothetical protein